LQQRATVTQWLGVLRAAVSAVYSRQTQHITVKRLDLPAPVAPMDHETACLVVDSVDGLRGLRHEFPTTFRDSFDELARRVARGCVACLARRKRADGAGYQIIGYELAERGVFSALGRRKKVAADVVFSHWAEVLPAYRGQRIHGLMFAARDAFFRGRGGRMVVGVCAPRNRASLQALRRDGAVVVGRVKQISLLGRLIVWETPWSRIEHALDAGRRLGATGAVVDVEDLAPKHA
jgi:hypothetical protein